MHINDVFYVMGDTCTSIGLKIPVRVNWISWKCFLHEIAFISLRLVSICNADIWHESGIGCVVCRAVYTVIIAHLFRMMVKVYMCIKYVEIHASFCSSLGISIWVSNIKSLRRHGPVVERYGSYILYIFLCDARNPTRNLRLVAFSRKMINIYIYKILCSFYLPTALFIIILVFKLVRRRSSAIQLWSNFTKTETSPTKLYVIYNLIVIKL